MSHKAAQHNYQEEIILLIKKNAKNFFIGCLVVLGTIFLIYVVLLATVKGTPTPKQLLTGSYKITATPTPTPKTYTVKEGDFLWSIAESIYGDGNMAFKIIEANKDIILDIDSIEPGTILRIP